MRFKLVLKLVCLMLEASCTALSTRSWCFLPSVCISNAFLTCAYVLAHVPTQLGGYNAREERSCLEKVGNWVVV